MPTRSLHPTLPDVNHVSDYHNKNWRAFTGQGSTTLGEIHYYVPRHKRQYEALKKAARAAVRLGYFTFIKDGGLFITHRSTARGRGRFAARG